MTQEVSKYDPDQVKKARARSGESTGTYIPFVPILEINNKTTKKTVVIDGEDTEVEVPAAKGWNITTRNPETKEYKKELFIDDLDAVVLKDRFMIESKYKKDPTAIHYRTDEFDSFDEKITVYNKKNRKEIIIEGSYAEVRDNFTSDDGKGKKIKDYDLYVILYIHHQDEVYRAKIKMTTDNNWFEYKNAFNDSETYVGIKTKLDLIQKTGEITYWHINFERGDVVDLEKELAMQDEIQKFFEIKEKVTKKPDVDEGRQDINDWTDDDDAAIEGEVEVDKDKLDKLVDEIPF